MVACLCLTRVVYRSVVKAVKVKDSPGDSAARAVTFLCAVRLVNVFSLLPCCCLGTEKLKLPCLQSFPLLHHFFCRLKVKSFHYFHLNFNNSSSDIYSLIFALLKINTVGKMIHAKIAIICLEVLLS